MQGHPLLEPEPSEIERPLPMNLEAEQAVLGCVLLDPRFALDELLTKMQGPEFYANQHRRLYTVIAELAEGEQPIDLVTIVSRLKDKGWLEQAGGVRYIADLTASVPSAASIGHYIGLVLEKYKARQLIIDLREQYELASSGASPETVLGATQARLEAIGEIGTEREHVRSLRDVMMSVFDEVEERYNNQGNDSSTGIPSGFVDLDRMTSGFQRNDLIIVAARPSVGKTAFALNVAHNASERAGETVAIFSLEMSEKQLGARMLSAAGHIDAGRIRTGHLEGQDWENTASAIGILSNLPIVIDDTPALTIIELRAKCRRIKKERGLGLILIDYLQLLVGRGKPGESRQEEVSYISRMLKQIARELEVPVIALSQLSRAVEQRQDKRPMLSDLRESGSLEQDADVVAFLYRDDYYNRETEKQNIIEIIIAKQRNGPTGMIELAFLKHFNKFLNLDRSHFEHDSYQAPEERQRKRNIPDMRGGGKRR